MLFKRITIIGVGLIGGSVGLAVKKRGLAEEVTGICRRRSSLVKAKKYGVIDKGFCADYTEHRTPNTEHRISDADLVVIATPVKTIVPIFDKIRPFLKEGAVVIDVGSTKREILGKVKDSRFVGCHPMAGLEKSGVEFASAELFEGAVAIVTPSRDTDKKRVLQVRKFWKALGSKVVCMNSAEHDRRVAEVSHLPHIISSALLRSVDEKSMAVAGSAFKDMTRIAHSSSAIWNDIYSTNRKEISRAMRRFLREMDKISFQLSGG